MVQVSASGCCERLTGVSQTELLGDSSKDLFHDPHDLAFFTRVAHCLSTKGFWEGEIWRMREGRTPSAVQVSWVLLRDDGGEVVQTICFFRDLTEKLAAQQRIETLAYSDVLTGLPNRLLLSQRVEFALRIAERNGGQFAIFFLDLDRFKNINDSMGHAFDDQVLMEVAGRIKQCTPCLCWGWPCPSTISAQVIPAWPT